MTRMEALNRCSDLRAQLGRTNRGGSLLEIDAWIPSEVRAITPLVDRLMRLIEGSHCITGEEHAVQLALREALNNAVVHGNRLDARKLVHVRCRCKVGNGIWLIVSDQGQGFDAEAIPDLVDVENLEGGARTWDQAHEVGDGRGLVPTGRHRGSLVQEASSQDKRVRLGRGESKLKRFLWRAGVEVSFVHDQADFGPATLYSGATTRSAQPSASFAVRF